jgi:hypothetical protein
MQVAIPKNIEDPYAITVRSSAVDDQCGSIAITQPFNYTVINVNCSISPGILVDVCKELWTGLKDVVAEVQSMKHTMSQLEHSMQQKLSKQEEKHEQNLSELKDLDR